ncbi:MAG: energy-coupling factor transporter ATPase [Clostridiales bacterium]|nr:energy-coupling factor transporter ATPase [Clostridiales bacterium]
MIEVRELHYQYEGKNEALKGVGLTVPAGQFLVILGHNGSGKSTLAKHLNGLLLPASGQVLIDGLDSQNQADFWALRQRVGMVFQNPDNQLIATSVEEDTAFGPENLGVEPALIRSHVDEALVSVGMEEYKERAVHLLSGGQKQRVAIAGVMAMRPKVLVLDEPTAMLDPRGRREVMSAVHKLNEEEGITVVYITHIMEEAVAAHRVVVMEEGRIVMDGSPLEIFNQVEKLKELRLDVPPAVEMAHRLRQRGFPLPLTILTIEELAEALQAAGGRPADALPGSGDAAKPEATLCP